MLDCLLLAGCIECSQHLWPSACAATLPCLCCPASCLTPRPVPRHPSLCSLMTPPCLTPPPGPRPCLHCLLTPPRPTPAHLILPSCCTLPCPCCRYTERPWLSQLQKAVPGLGRAGIEDNAPSFPDQRPEDVVLDGVYSLMNLAYAWHEIISDYTTASLMWLESGCVPRCGVLCRAVPCCACCAAVALPSAAPCPGGGVKKTQGWPA